MVENNPRMLVWWLAHPYTEPVMGYNINTPFRRFIQQIMASIPLNSGILASGFLEITIQMAKCTIGVASTICSKSGEAVTAFSRKPLGQKSSWLKKK